MSGERNDGEDTGRRTDTGRRNDGQPQGQPGGQSRPGGQGQRGGGSQQGGQQGPGGPPDRRQGGQQQPPAEPGQQPPGGPSVADRLREPVIAGQIKTAVATFAVVGLGLGLSALFTMGLIGTTSTVSTIAVTVVVLSGPLLAVVFGLRMDDVLATEADAGTTAAAGAVGGGVGFLLMGFLANILVLVGSGGSLEFGEAIVPVFVAAIPAAIVAAAVPYARNAF